MPPRSRANTEALVCFSFTNACVVSTIIIFRCNRMAPPHSKRLGLSQRVYTMIQVIHNTYTYECDREYVLTQHYCNCRHNIIVGGVYGQSSISAKRRGKQANMSFWAKKIKVSSKMCLLGATHDVWCSMASAAVFGATVFGVATVASVVFGAAEVGVSSGVLYGAVLVHQWLV